MMVPPSGKEVSLRDCDMDMTRHFDMPKSAIWKGQSSCSKNWIYLLTLVTNSSNTPEGTACLKSLT